MNKNLQHSPGKWVAIHNGVFWEIKVDGTVNYIGNVCATEPENHESGLQEANARIMSAAPDMLDVIQDAIKYMKARHRGGAMPAWVSDALAALKKAKDL